MSDPEVATPPGSATSQGSATSAGSGTTSANGTSSAEPQRGRRLGGRRLLVVYIIGMLVALAVGTGVAIALTPPPPVSGCPPLPNPCAPPPNPLPNPLPHASTNSAGECVPTVGQLGSELIVGKVIELTDLGVEFVYDDCRWDVTELDGSHALLTTNWRNHAPSTVWIGGAASGDRTTRQLILGRQVAGPGLDAQLDPDPYYQINGPEIGYLNTGAVAETYTGTVVDADGTPIGSGEWSYIAATNGTVSMAVEVFDQQPDDLFQGDDSLTYHAIALYLADILIKDFRWSITS